jgi:folate-binding protein YgfZ
MDEREIYLRARREAAFTLLPGQALYAATGVDQLDWLNGQLTNDVRPATAAQAVYATICGVKGMLEGDCFVFRAPEEGDIPGGNFRVSTGPALAASLLSRFDRFIIADDVLWDDLSPTWRQLHLLGPKAAEIIAALPVQAPAQWVRTDRYGVPGYDLLAPAKTFDALLAAVSAKAPELPAGLAERVRIEEGRPAWGHEAVKDILPQEAGLEDLVVNYHKGCYIGQEIISRVKTSGKTRRQVRGFTAEAGSAAQAGMELYAGPEPEAARVGVITSVAQSFPGEGVFGLASVKTGYENAARQLWVAGRDGVPAWPVTVADLPFPPAGA